jgi:hypothetical protein
VVTVPVHACGTNDPWVRGWKLPAGCIRVANAGDDDDVVINRVLNVSSVNIVVEACVGQAKHFRSVIDRNPDTPGQRASIESR